MLWVPGATHTVVLPLNPHRCPEAQPQETGQSAQASPEGRSWSPQIGVSVVWYGQAEVARAIASSGSAARSAARIKMSLADPQRRDAP